MSAPSRDIYSISRLNNEVRAVLDNSFPLLWVSGEISNLTAPRSGHLYLTLKDEHAQVRCALFRNKRQLLRFTPKSGDQVLVRARIGFYEPRGDFQLIIEHMELAGDGSAQLAFEALKKKLQQEGLFDNERKLSLPDHPNKIGIITSPSGAAVQDILKVLKRRAPSIPVQIFPTLVQGAEAPEEIIKALNLAQQRNDCDLLILTRGGGAAEDLIAFNDERLARTIAALNIPLISAIGHEIDFTISDFVADRRAPTPSAAAELASPDTEHLQHRVDSLSKRINNAFSTQFMRRQKALEILHLKLQRNNPSRLLQQRQQHLDELEQQLSRFLDLRLRKHQQRLEMLNQRLFSHSPRNKLHQANAMVGQLRERLSLAWQHKFQFKQQHLQGLVRQLNTVSPLSTMERGYAIVRTPDTQNIVLDSSTLKPGDKVEALVHQGRFTATVDKIIS